MGNGALPTGDYPVSDAFMDWRKFATTSPEFDIGRIIQRATILELPDDVVAAYDAPFPDDTFKAGASTSAYDVSYVQLHEADGSKPC